MNYEPNFYLDNNNYLKKLIEDNFDIDNVIFKCDAELAFVVINKLTNKNEEIVCGISKNIKNNYCPMLWFYTYGTGRNYDLEIPYNENFIIEKIADFLKDNNVNRKNKNEKEYMQNQQLDLFDFL